MDDYKTIRNEIDELRNILISYQNFDNIPQDLMNQFFKVKEVSPETYELIILIYNEFQLLNKSNKKQVFEIINKILNVKNILITKLIEEKTDKKQKTVKTDKKQKTYKVLDFLTWKNMKRAFALWLIGVTFIFTLAYINDKAFIEISKHFDKFFEEIFTTISTIKK